MEAVNGIVRAEHSARIEFGAYYKLKGRAERSRERRKLTCYILLILI